MMTNYSLIRLTDAVHYLDRKIALKKSRKSSVVTMKKILIIKETFLTIINYVAK